MGLHLSRKGYSVRVDGVQLRDSRFVIRAEIAYAARLSKDDRMRLSPEAELDVLLGIEGEEQQWRAQAAEASTRARQAARRAGLLGRGEQPGLAVAAVEEA